MCEDSSAEVGDVPSIWCAGSRREWITRDGHIPQVLSRDHPPPAQRCVVLESFCGAFALQRSQKDSNTACRCANLVSQQHDTRR
jgi:hypothetical protein